MKQDTKPVMISASELGGFVFCPEAARLKTLGARPNAQAQQRMAAGEQAHDSWQRQRDAEGTREPSLLIAILGVLALVILALFLLGW